MIGGSGGIIGALIHAEAAKRAEDRHRAECFRQRGIRHDGKQKGDDGMMKALEKIFFMAEKGDTFAIGAITCGCVSIVFAASVAVLYLWERFAVDPMASVAVGLAAVAIFAGRYALRNKGDG